MTKLTTHVLDTATGVPAKNMAIRLKKMNGDALELLVETRTNSDGRCEQPLLAETAMQPGVYQLEFEVGEYFASADEPADFAFLDCVVVRFGINDPTSHYHVPLLVSPYSYSTYRGS